MKIINGFVVMRVFLGAIFIVSGTEKLLSPVENFIYVIQGYDLILDPWLIRVVALVFPWVELLTGVFLAAGLWTRDAVILTGAMGAGFLVFVTQAVLRDLPLADCGCFGDLVQWPLWGTLLLDVIILGCSVALYLNLEKTTLASLDRKLS